MPPTTQASSLLSAIAHLLDDACAPHPDHTIVLLLDDADDPGQLTFAMRSVGPDRHPCDELRHLVVPAGCWGVAVVAHGRAHHLDALDLPAEPIVTTYVHHRDGRQVSLLRRGGRVVEERGPVEGRVPDLCRRLFERGSQPPPDATASDHGAP